MPAKHIWQLSGCSKAKTGAGGVGTNSYCNFNQTCALFHLPIVYSWSTHRCPTLTARTCRSSNVQRCRPHQQQCLIWIWIYQLNIFCDWIIEFWSYFVFPGSWTAVPTGALHRVTAGLRRRPPEDPSESEPDSAKEDVRRRWKQCSLSSFEADWWQQWWRIQVGLNEQRAGVHGSSRQLQPQREDRSPDQGGRGCHQLWLRLF